MKNEPIIHDKHHPTAASGQVDNAYYLRHCPIVERGPAYAACLSRLSDISAGRSNERTAQCQRAVDTGACIAHGMREQETIAGSALFYFPRPANKPYLPMSVAGDFGVQITNHTDPALYTNPPKVAPAKPVVVDGGTFADALNMALKDPAPVTTVTLPHHGPVDLEAKPLGTAKKGDLSITTLANAGPSPGDMPLDRMIKALPLPIPPEPPKTAATTRPPMNPGETPLQYARRLAALKTST